MKKLMIVTLFVSLAGISQARADGFVCQTVEGDLNVKMYNNTQPSQGTRNAAVLVISDTSVNAGRKTIARFTDVNETLVNTGASFAADVDLRFNDSGRKGELISGTKLGELKQILVDVAFSYAYPVAKDESLSGTMTLIKRNGQEISRDLECTRYLKQ